MLIWSKIKWPTTDTWLVFIWFSSLIVSKIFPSLFRSVIRLFVIQRSFPSFFRSFVCRFKDLFLFCLFVCLSFRDLFLFRSFASDFLSLSFLLNCFCSPWIRWKQSLTVRFICVWTKTEYCIESKLIFYSDDKTWFLRC